MTPSLQIRPGLLLEADGGTRVRVDLWRGEGSYARVYRAALLPGGRPCALKAAKVDIPDAVDRLAHERGALTTVRHSHVVRLLDTGSAADVPFLLLEWLDGENLRDLVAARRRLPLRQALEIFSTLSDAIAAFHQAGIPHGDVRPENVVLPPGRGAVLTDPGPPVDQPRPGSPPTHDIRMLGDLLHLMLTGQQQQAAPATLSSGAGFNPAVLDLWERTRGPEPTAARDLHAAAELIRRRL